MERKGGRKRKEVRGADGKEGGRKEIEDEKGIVKNKKRRI